MISQLRELKQCREQIRKCQSWLVKAPIDFTNLNRALDGALDEIEKRVKEVA